MKNSILKLSALFASAVLAAQVHAAVIDFNSLEQAGGSLINVGGSYSEDGFTITDMSGGNVLYYAQQSSNQYAGSAGLHVRVGNGLLDLNLSSSSGAFSLKSIDLSILANYGTSPAVTFTGFLIGGGMVTQTFTPTTFGFQTYTFSSAFSNLDYVRWNQGTDEGNAHQFDNIVLSVPEAGSTIALMSLGLAALAAFRSKRSAA